MTDEEEYQTIQRALREGHIASSLLEAGSDFLHAVENLKATYKEAIFEEQDRDERDKIFFKMTMMDELVHDLAIAQLRGHKVTQYIEEQDAAHTETETEE